MGDAPAVSIGVIGVSSPASGGARRDCAGSVALACNTGGPKAVVACDVQPPNVMHSTEITAMASVPTIPSNVALRCECCRFIAISSAANVAAVKR